MKACMGGWCRIRESCEHYATGDRMDAAERLCDAGDDGRRGGEAIIIRRAAGTWERPFIPSMLRPADVFDGLTA